MSIEFFAEIGSNYITNKGTSWLRALELINKLVYLGCAGVKFQYFKADKLWHSNMKKELEDARKVELPLNWIEPLSIYARERGLLFGLSVFNVESIDEVKDFVDYFKIASFEAEWLPLVKKCYLTGKRLMISLGQSSTVEIIKILKELPERDNQIDLLHCVSKYPAEVKDCNLNVIKQDFQLINGWSDHTCEPGVIYAAVGAGAKVIEFHLDLNDCGGLETIHSWKNFHTLQNVIINCNKMEKAMGSHDWSDVVSQQDRKYKVNPITGLRGK